MMNIIFITIAAVICGAETWNDMEQYGKSRQEWLGKYLDLPNGIPAHYTFNRIALNLLKNELSRKRSVKGKRPDAGWNNDYLFKILMN